MKFNLAILSVLAARPEQRIPVEEVSREVKRMIAVGDAATKLKRSSELGDADVFQSGWGSINETGLQITDSGLALWRSLEASRAEQEIVERERVEQEPDEPQAQRLEMVAADAPDARGDTVVERPDAFDRRLPRVIEQQLADRTMADADRSTAAPDPSARAPIVPEPAFGSIHQVDRGDSRLSQLAGWLGTRMPRLGGARQRRSTDDVPDPRSGHRGGMTGLAVACLSLVSVVACVAAAIALGQVSSLKSDNAALRRELVPLRDRLARLEQDAAKREAAEQDQAQDKAEAERKAADADSEQAALNLSREEIQLIREYIKAAPSAGAAAPAVNVGDPITGGMIPLPSSLTQKVPRLVGARFATRNGAIIISMRRSRRIDAVLMPN